MNLPSFRSTKPQQEYGVAEHQNQVMPNTEVTCIINTIIWTYLKHSVYNNKLNSSNDDHNFHFHSRRLQNVIFLYNIM